MTGNAAEVDPDPVLGTEGGAGTAFNSSNTALVVQLTGTASAQNLLFLQPKQRKKRQRMVRSGSSSGESWTEVNLAQCDCITENIPTNLQPLTIKLIMELQVQMQALAAAQAQAQLQRQMLAQQQALLAAVPTVTPPAAALVAAAAAGGATVATSVAVDSTTARKSREVYIGNLSIGSVSPEMLTELFNAALAGMVPDPVNEPPVINVKMDTTGVNT